MMLWQYFANVSVWKIEYQKSDHCPTESTPRVIPTKQHQINRIKAYPYSTPNQNNRDNLKQSAYNMLEGSMTVLLHMRTVYAKMYYVTVTSHGAFGVSVTSKLASKNPRCTIMPETNGNDWRDAKMKSGR